MLTRRMLAASAALLAAPRLVRAQSQTQGQPWQPTRPLRLIVPYAAGGSADQTARMVADALGARLGQSVVVENKPGGAATIGAQAVARAAPDGLTLLYGTPGPQMINPWLMASLPYDAEKDFTPICGIKRAPNLLCVNPSVPAKNVPELLDYAKANPGKLTFASAGVSSSSHLAGEMLKYLGKIDIVHVPFRGTGPAITELLAGNVHMAIDTLGALLPHAQSGGLRALAVSTPKRSPLVPEIPAIAETLPGFDAAPFNYLAGPGNLPAPIVARLNQEMVAILSDPAFRKRMEAQGEEPTPSTPEELAATIRAETARWGTVIKAANIKIE
ncbi:tripartite tricarboxylate transporter substrate binding protein [Acetobacteraceae bacterium H6797]|nr:tripartite tricarboxylate transporter substrate binding protein [Acetobacteraceae bacterium H6797]